MRPPLELRGHAYPDEYLECVGKASSPWWLMAAVVIAVTLLVAGSTLLPRIVAAAH